MDTIISIATGKIRPSPTNPRKHFDDAKLIELGESIRAHGLQNAIKVRPVEDQDDNGYEIVHGERRWRAVQRVGLTEIQAIVEDLDDEQVLELQLIENVMRVDISPIEEAEAYAALMKQPDYTIERLAARTGKSKAHLYGRIKLAGLTGLPRELMAAGRLPASHAELIARLPDEKLQRLAAMDAVGDWSALKGKEAEGNEYRDDDLANEGFNHEQVPDDTSERKGYATGSKLPLSFRAFQKLIHSKYATRLESAPFDTLDAELVPGANSCAPCPHRSGNEPGLFPDLTQPADVCTKPSCYSAKLDAVYKIREKEARAKAMPVLSEKETHEKARGYNAKYVEPTAEVPYDLLPASARTGTGKVPTWEKLLGKKIEAPRVLARDERGAPVELLDKAAAIAVLTEAGKLDKPTKPGSKSSGNDADARKEREKEKAKAAIKEAAFSHVLAQIADDLASFDVSSDVATKAGKKTVAALRWITTRVLEDAQNVDYERLEAVAERRGFGGGDAGEMLERALEKSRTAGQVLSLLVEVLLAVIGDAVERGSGYRGELEAFKTACDLFGADWAKAQELAKQAAASAAKAAADAKGKSVAPKKAGAK